MTNSYKRMMLKSMSNMPLKSDGGKFPVLLMRFLSPFDLYKRHGQTIHVTGTTYHGKEHLETYFFQPVGEKSLHCIITNSGMSSWVLITKFDVFIPNKKDLNGCGYSAPAENIATFSVKTTVEKNKGRPFLELIIQCGDYQLVATAGLYGRQDRVCHLYQWA